MTIASFRCVGETLSVGDHRTGGCSEGDRNLIANQRSIILWLRFSRVPKSFQATIDAYELPRQHDDANVGLCLLGLRFPLVLTFRLDGFKER